MKRGRLIAKRGFAGFMALVMLLALAPAAALAVGTTVDGPYYRSLVLNEAGVAGDLRTAVEALVPVPGTADPGYDSSFIRYTTPDPNNGEGLVTVDSAALTVAASPFTDPQGNVWSPASAKVRWSDNSEENIDLSVGTFTDKDLSYGVEVTYELYAAIDDSDGLLTDLGSAVKAVSLVGAGLKKMAAVADPVGSIYGDLQVLDGDLDKLFDIADNGYPVDYGGVSVTVYLPTTAPDDGLYNGAKALQAHMAANGGHLKLVTMMGEYNAIASAADRVAWIRANGAEVLAQVDFLEEQITKMATCPVLGSLATELTEQGDSRAVAINALQTAFTNLSAALTAAGADKTDCGDGADGDWMYLNETALLDGFDLSPAADAIESLAGSGTWTDHAAPVYAAGDYYVANATVSQNVDQSTVTLALDLTVTAKDNSAWAVTGLGTSFTHPSDYAVADLMVEIEDYVNTTLKSIDDGDAYYDVYDESANGGLGGLNDAGYARVDTAPVWAGGTTLGDGDVTYTVTITPKTYTYSIYNDTAAGDTVPYGYVLTLPSCTESGKVFDYDVEDGTGRKLFEGQTLRILEDVTVKATKNVAYDDYRLGEVIAQDETLGATLTTEEKNILKSRAFDSGMIYLRQPKGGVTVTGSGTDLIVDANVFPTLLRTSTSTAGDTYNWIPVSVVPVMTDDSYGTETAIVGADTDSDGVDDLYQVTIPAAGVKRVEVTYALTLNNAAVMSTVNADLALPAAMTAQAVAQSGAMKLLDTKYNRLNALDQSTLNKIRFAINTDIIKTQDNGYADGLGHDAAEAVNKILTECLTGTELTLKKLLDPYHNRISDAEGLVYYYKNEADILASLQKLSTYVNIINSDPNLEKAFDVTFEGHNYKDDIIYFTDTAAALASARATLEANPVDTADIILSNENLLSLVENLLADNASAHSATQLVLLQTVPANAAPGMATFTLNLQTKDSSGNITDAAIYRVTRNDGVLGGDAAALNGYIAAYDGNLNTDASTPYFTQDPADPGLTAATGLTDDWELTVTWTPIIYTVTIQDGDGNVLDTQNITALDPTVDLPAYSGSGYRYEYHIDGAAASVTAGTITLPVGDHYIVRDTIDETTESLLNLVQDLNSSMNSKLPGDDGTGMASFILVGADASTPQSLVLRISPENSGTDRTGAIAAIAQDIIGRGLEIQVKNPAGGYETLYDGASTLDITALTDALLNSGARIDNVNNAVDADGRIKEMALPGAAIINLPTDTYSRVGDATVLGGQLLTFDLKVGSKDIKLYVTLEDFGKSTSRLNTMVDNVDRLLNYMDIALTGGNIQIEIKSEKAYKAYLASALAAGFATKDDFYDYSDAEYIEFLYDYIEDLILDESVNISTYINTANEIRYVDSINDLARFDKYYTKYVHKLGSSLVNNSDKVGTDANNLTWSFKYDLESVLTKLKDKGGMPDETLNAFAKDSSGTYTYKPVSYGVKVVFPGATYVAAIADPDASGVSKLKFATAADLQSLIDASGSNAAILMLTDYTGDLTLSGNKELDLNGKTITGNINAANAGRVVILDSALDNYDGATKIGTVTGSVTGKALTVDEGSAANLKLKISGLMITGGKYAADVSAFLPNDYVQSSEGIVSNGIYTIRTSGDDIYFILNPKLTGLPSPKIVAGELAFDLAMNFYTAAGLTVDGNEFYDFHMDDIAHMVRHASGADADEVLSEIKIGGVNAFIATVIADLEDLASHQAAFEAPDGTLASYPYSTKGWTFEIEKDASRDKLDINVKASDTARIVKNGTIYIVAGGDNQADIAKLLDELDAVTTFDGVSLVLDQPTRSGKTLVLGGTSAGSVTFDLTQHTDYAIAVGVIMANGVEDAAKKAALIDGIKAWYDGHSLTTLHNAFNALTSSDLIKAMEKYNRSTDFNNFVDGLGMGDPYTANAKALTGENPGLVETYKGVLASISFALRKYDPTGTDATMDSFETGLMSGTYTDSRSNVTRNADATVRGYTVDATGLVSNVTVTVKLFTDKFITITKDGETDPYYTAVTGDKTDEAFDTVFVDKDVVRIFADVVPFAKDHSIPANVNITVYGSNYLDVDSYTITLNDASTVTTDTQIGVAAFKAYDETTYKVKETDNGDGTWTYSLEEKVAIKVIPTDTTLTKTYATPDKINEAFTYLASNGGKGIIEIYEDVTLSADIEISKTQDVTVLTYTDNASHGFTAGSYKIKLRGDAFIIFDRVVDCTTVHEDDANLFTHVGPEMAGTAASGKTLYKYYTTPKTFTITYDYDGATTTPTNPESYIYSDLPITLTRPAKTGYTFDSWTVAVKTGETGTVNSSGDVIQAGTYGNLTVKANWTAADVNYTVKHWQQNITDDLYTEVTADAETKTGKTGENTAAAAKTYTGFTAQAITQKPIAADGSTVVNIYYNRDTHTVAYSYTGTVPAGAPSVPASATYKYGASYSVAAAPTLEGYVFSGWSLTGAQTMDTSDVTITGSWSAGTVNYTVKHWQQNIDDDLYTEVTADAETLTGTTGDNTAAAAKTYTGFTAQAITQKTIAADGSTVVDVYYDRDTYTVTYTYTGSVPAGVTAPVDASSPYRYGATVTVAAAPTAPAGYTFGGWSKTGTFVIDADTDITGSWTLITYHINFYKDDTTTLVEAVPFTAETTTITEPAVPAKTDNADWYDVGAWGTYDLTDLADQDVTPTYTKKTFTITFQDESGTDLTDQGPDNTFDFDDRGVTPPAVPAKAGYTGAWPTLPTDTASDAAVQPVYTAISYTIKYNANGGTAIADKTYTIESTDTLPAATGKTGYTFKEWKVTTAGGSWTADAAFNAGEALTGKYGNVTLTAQWTPITYHINFKNDGGTLVEAVPFTAETATITEPAVPAKSTDADWYDAGTWGTYDLTNLVDQDVTPTYTKKTFTVTFQDESGTPLADQGTDRNFDFDDRGVTPPAVPAKAGYTGAWTVDTSTPGNKTVRPDYTPVNYTITFDTDGGTAIPAMTYNIESAGTLPSAAGKTGYTFKEWKVTTADGSWTAGATFNGGSALAGKYGNVTLQAQWTKDSVTPPAPTPVIKAYHKGSTGYYVSETDPTKIDSVIQNAIDGDRIEILGNVQLGKDATIPANTALTITGADKLDLNGHKIVMNPGATLTTDKQIPAGSFTVPDGYKLKETKDGSNYVYTLEKLAQPIIEVYHSGDDTPYVVYTEAAKIVDSFNNAVDGDTIKLLGSVALNTSVTIKAGSTITLDRNGNTFTVGSGVKITLQRDGAKKAALKINATINQASQLDKKYADGSDDIYSKIVSAKSGDYTTFTLEALTPDVTVKSVSTTNGTVSTSNANKILSAKVDNSERLIIIDVLDPVSLNKTVEGAQHAGNGITPLEFRAQVVFDDANVAAKDFAYTSADGAALDNSKCIGTGTQVTITASNPDYTADNGGTGRNIVYTVVVMGDTDCDGIISNKDNVLMQNYYIDKSGTVLSGYPLMAANVNQDSDTTMNQGSVDNNDKLQNLIKYWRPWDYKTHLENTVG